MKRMSWILAVLGLVAWVAHADPFYDGPKSGITLTQLACAGVASDTNSRVSIAEAQTDVILTTITLGNVVLTATDGSAEGESLKLCDFDGGAFTVLDCVADLTCSTSPGATNTYVMSLGTAAANDAADLTGTEADLIPSTSLNTLTGTVTSLAFDAVLAAPANFNGTATAKALYINMGVADADMNANVTNTITGTIYLRTTKAIDDQ